jgi:hypothetical protein
MSFTDRLRGRLVSLSKSQIQRGASLVSSTLKNNPIWHSLAQALQQVEPNQIATQHLQVCNYQINGYWNEDEFYEVVTFNQKLEPELISSSLGISPVSKENAHWLNLKFSLNVNHDLLPQPEALGELTLILDENLKVVDENWLIDLNSPCVLAQQ